MSVILVTPIAGNKTYTIDRYVSCINNLDPVPDEILLLFDSGDFKTKTFFLSALQRKLEKSIKLTSHFTSGHEDHLEAIGRARVTAVEYARKTAHTHLFFLDVDIVCHPNAIQRLIWCNNGISSGLVATRELPPGFGKRPTKLNAYLKRINGESVFYESMLEVPKDSIIKVDVVGNDCMMIHRDLFIQQNYKWSIEPPRKGEDFDYCLRAKEKGFEVTIDGSVWCDHYSPVEVFSTKTGKAERTFLE